MGMDPQPPLSFMYGDNTLGPATLDTKKKNKHNTFNNFYTNLCILKYENTVTE